jgi:hypothetical protein
MTMEALPGSSLEVIEPEFFFQLLMGLFANPSRLDHGSWTLFDHLVGGSSKERRVVRPCAFAVF